MTASSPSPQGPLQPAAQRRPAAQAERRDLQARFWNRLARQYAADPIADLPGYEKSLARTAAQLDRTCSVLEIGCGTGTTALRLAPGCAAYRATDLSSEMISIAREKLASRPVAGLAFDVADADEPSAGSNDGPTDGPFDRLLAFNVLHLVQDLDAAIAGCVAALAPGGLLISKTPCLREMNWLIPNIALPVARLIGRAPPVQCLAQADLEAAMRRQGIDIVAVERHASRGRDFRPFIVARKPGPRRVRAAGP
jgi:2-polyprenyl-3-methyl-5-hydroxy-6-metoxy-1,4-benzoquinol methylase